MASPFVSRDTRAHPMPPDACDFQVMTGRSYIKRNLRQSAGDFHGVFKLIPQWVSFHGEKASLWGIGKQEFICIYIYISIFLVWRNPVDMVNKLLDVVNLSLVDDFWSMWTGVRIVGLCPSTAWKDLSTMPLALSRLGRRFYFFIGWVHLFAENWQSDSCELGTSESSKIMKKRPHDSTLDSHRGSPMPRMGGDVRQILRLVEEAEKLPWPDKKELGHFDRNQRFFWVFWTLWWEMEI